MGRDFRILGVLVRMADKVAVFQLILLMSCALVCRGSAQGGDIQSKITVEGGGKVAGTCVCVFDFDHTLRVQNETGWDVGSKDSKGIVRKCRELGYEVALASANCDEAKMRFVLPNRIDDDIFTDRFFESPAFQHCDPWKTKELTKLLEHFETPPQCMMFFDDLSYNVHKHATDVGIHWRHVDEDHGVLWEDFGSLHADLLRTCECKPRIVDLD